MEPMDIWRSAKLMVLRHAAAAPEQCAETASAMRRRGDLQGEILWLAIERAARSLLEYGVPADITIN